MKQQLIWNKNSLIMGRQDYQWKHEPCLYGWKDTGPHSFYADRKQATVINCDRPSKADIHPTMKPIGLFDYQIKNSTKEGDVVLDLFSGSGTTIVACEQNNRIAYGMEYDPKYCDAIVKRWQNLTGGRYGGKRWSRDTIRTIRYVDILYNHHPLKKEWVFCCGKPTRKNSKLQPKSYCFYFF